MSFWIKIDAKVLLFSHIGNSFTRIYIDKVDYIFIYYSYFQLFM